MEETAGFQNTALGKPTKKPRKPLFIVIAAIIVLILIFGAFKLIGGSKSKKQSETVTPTPTQFQIPTDTPTPSISTSPTPTSKPTSEPTPSSRPTSNPIDQSTGLNRSKLNVAVQNGSGEAGVAGKAADFLKSLGYNVISTGNADNYNYTNVTIQVKSGESDYLSLLKKDLGKEYTVGASSSDLSASSSADALVVVGK